MKRITTSEVAKAAGVSIGAASVVLNGGTKKIGVSEKTRARILRAAAKLGYRLNPAARATRTGKFGSVALLLGRIDYNSLVSGSRLSCILDATENRNLSLTLTRADDERLSDERFLHDLLARIYADGLLIGYNAALPPLFIKLLTRLQIPAVWLNAKMNQNAVYPDDRAAARKLTESCIAAGFRDIVFINNKGDTHYSFFDRKEGYEDAMSAHALRPQVIIAREDDNCQVFADQFANLFAARHPKRVFICYSNLHVTALVQAARQRGQTPGKDFRVATFGEKTVENGDYQIPTAIMDEQRLTEEAVSMLLKRIENPTTDLTSVPIPYANIPRPA